MTMVWKSLFLLLVAILIVPCRGQTTFTPCDVNHFGSTTVADVQTVVNQALGIASAVNDLNGDGIVNAQDIQIDIDAALNLGCPEPPTITGFSPASGPIGALVTVTGANFGSAPKISMPKLGGGIIAQPLSGLSAGSLTFAVVAGTASGPITLINSLAAVSTNSSFTVTPANTFSLVASPSSANLIQGQSVAYSVQLNSTDGFNQPAALSVTGLPTGVTASFAPPSVAAGQASVLTLTAPVNQPVAPASLSITASATVEGIPMSESAPVSLAIVTPTTSFIGRTVVANAQETPLAGVTVSMLGRDGNGNTTGCSGSAVSDAAGNFALMNLPPACVGPQLVGFNGVTATSPPGTYAGVNIMYTLVSAQVTASPVLVHLPRIDNVETFDVTQNAAANQSYSFTSIPGLSVTVYAGTIFTAPDGTQPNPFPLAAVQVPVDRLPDLKPNVPTMIRAFIVAFQPANATTNQPVAVYFPNTLNTPPGTDMVLMTLDPTHGQMVPYGTGAVSSNATQIAPDADPAHPGHLYGLMHFDWHGPMPPPPPVTNPGPPGNGPGPCGAGGAPGGGDGAGGCGTPLPPAPPPGPFCPLRGSTATIPGSTFDVPKLLAGARDGMSGQETAQAGDPVDLSSGIQVITNTDIAFAGSRGSIALVRTYRSLTSNPGPFGIGTGHNYSLQLNVTDYVRNGSGIIYMVWPDGNQFPFSLTGPGTFVNSSVPAFAGAVFSNPSTGVYSLRYRNGLIYGFRTSSLGGLEAYLTSITDPNGNTTTITLNPSQPLQITQITDPVGRSLTLAYDSSSRIVSVTDPIGRTVHYSYNAQGTLATFTDANGGITRHEYDANNNLIRITDPRGTVQIQNTLDSSGRVIQQVRPDGGVLTFAYSVTNPLAVASTSFVAGAPSLSVSVSPMMTAQVTDSLGVQTTYRFNMNGFVTDITNTQGQTEHFILQPGTNLRLSDTFGQATTSYTYDSNGNVRTWTDATGLTTSFTYDAVFSRITSNTDPLGNVTSFVYDSKGNLLTATDANGNVTSFQYNSAALPTKLIDALQQATSISYDGLGNPIAITDPLGNIASFVYDQVSRLTQTIDPLGRRTSYTYDGLDHVLTTTDAAGGVTKSVYDPNGNLTSITDANGNTNSFAYDPLNRILSRTDGLGHADSRTWDTDGNLRQYIDRRGLTSNYTYDNLNRLSVETYSDATVVRGYDIYGHLQQVDDSQGGMFSSSYDLAGRLLGSTTPYGAVNYTYDGRGAMASRQVAGQAALSYSYDPAGNLTSASMPLASATFSYTPRNQVSTARRANGVTTTYSYDADGRPLTIVHTNGALIVASGSYAYDPIGNRLSQATSVGQSLITSATTNAFNAANQMTKSGAAANSFDLNGNLTQQGNAATYTWDGRDRLKSILTSAGQLTAFVYDFAGNLLSQSDSGPASTLTRAFVLDDLTNVAYETASDGTFYSVLAGRAIDSHISISQSNGQTLYRLADGINSTVAAVDQGGTVQAQFFYEPFGQTTPTGAYPFQYTGRTQVSPSLFYYRARFYNSMTGTFLSEDPLSILTGANRYLYTGNNPIGFNDPSGQDSCLEDCKDKCELAGELCGEVAGPGVNLACFELCTQQSACKVEQCNIIVVASGPDYKTYCQQCPGQDTPICDTVYFGK
ncbi:MAG TPA: RHS repeat-associated core domain-containing protein [Bryobacteraceae bacterium]|nr:RHS repeat-associated core domain-containing protein [Bryobacteraceae bacterium]